MARSRKMRSRMVGGEEEERAKLEDQQARVDHEGACKTVGRIGNMRRRDRSKQARGARQ